MSARSIPHAMNIRLHDRTTRHLAAVDGFQLEHAERYGPQGAT